MAQSTITRDQFSAFLLPAPWWTAANLWAAQSSYTQAGPMPPVVEPAQADGLGVVASGTVTAIDDYDVRIQAAGFPSTDGASWAWRLDGGASDTWRGWDPPSLLAGWQTLFWDTGGTSGTTATSTPHTVALDDGSLLVAVQRTFVVGPTTSYQVAVYRVAPDGTETTAALYSVTTSPTGGFRPLLVAMPDGSVLCYAVVDASLRAWRSTNRGQTWALFREVCSTDVYDLRIRGCANASGEVLIIAAEDDGGNIVAHQLVSTDGGATFREVYETPTPASAPSEGIADVVALGDQFLVITGGGTNSVIKVFRPQYGAQPLSASAFSTFSSADEWTGSGELACCVDGSAVYLFTRVTTTSTSYENDVVGYRSPDGGITWQPIGQAASTDTYGSYATARVVSQGLINGASLSSSYPTDIAATAHAGRVILASNWTGDTTTTHEPSLAVLWLGGWTSVEMPQRGPSIRVDYRGEWSYSYLPFDLPSDVGWLTATTGTASASLQTPGEVYVTTTAGTFSYYTPASFQTSAGAAGIMVEMDVSLTQTETGTQDLFAIKVRSYSSIVGNDVIGKVRAWRTVAGNVSAALFDDVAGSQIGSTVTVAGEDVTILMHVQHGGAVAYIRSTGRGLSRVWTKIGEQTTALTTTATVGSEVRYGTLFSDTTEWAVRRVCIAKGATDVGDGLVGLSYPDTLRGRPCSVVPAWMTDGVRLAFAGGPAAAGDLYDLTGSADFPLAAALATQGSPSDPWRSASGSPPAAQSVAVALDPVLLGTAEGDFECDLIGVALLGCNWREGELQGYDVGSSAWVKIADIDLAANLTAFDWTRAGATVRLGGQAGRYIFANEFEGATLNLNGKLRRIGRHLEGRASTDTTIRQIVLPFEGVDGTEGASGSGTAAVWARNGVLIVNLKGATYAALRVVIDSQATVDGYLETGAIVAGPLQVVRGPSNGWSVGVEAETARVVGLGGQAYSRAMGPRRRVVRFGFADGLIAGGVESSPVGMAATSSSGGQGVWTEQGQPRAMLAIVDYLRGEAGRVVWLPRVPRANGGSVPDAFMLTRYEDLVYLEAPDNSTVENIQGNPLENELVRVAAFRLREVR